MTTLQWRIPDLSDLKEWWFEIKLGGVVLLAFAWGWAGHAARVAMWPPRPKEKRPWREL